MSPDWTLVIGLGNPGEQYADTRHNIGWSVIDTLARSLGAESVQRPSDVKPSEQWRSEDTLLVKPTTFMNDSGREVQRIKEYYKVPLNRLLVIADELDLPFGTAKLKEGGGSAGHKGISSIVRALGSEDFARLRVGIGRPPEHMDPSDFVLAPFDKEEADDLPRIVTAAADQTKEWLGV